MAIFAKYSSIEDIHVSVFEIEEVEVLSRFSVK